MQAFLKLMTVTTMLGLVIVMVLSVTAACGERRDSEPLTVREYAEACGELVDFVTAAAELRDVAGVADAKASFRKAEDAWTELGKLNPPQELQLVHGLLVDQIEVSLKFYKDSDVPGAIDVLDEIDEAEEKGDVPEEEEARLSAKFFALMEKIEESRTKFKEEARELESAAKQARSNLSRETLEVLSAERCVYSSVWQILRGADTPRKTL